MPPELGTTSEREQQLQEAVLTYLKAADAGQAPDPQALLAQHPELTKELTAFLDDHDQLDRLLAPLRAPAEHLREAEGRLLGDYKVLEKIGQGGMGVVYKARQVSLNRIVALKMIDTRVPLSAASRIRFQTEARAVAQLDHPNIVHVYQSGEHNGQQYFAMEFVPGGSLAEARKARPWSSREAAALVAHLAEAVEYAHRQGIVHRDLKPSNILVTPDGAPKITDFGLAKQLQADVASPTLSGDLLGTPAYMAREQAEGRLAAIGPSTDIFGLGAILYELLTDQPPFQGTTLEEVLAQARQGRVQPPRQLKPRVSRSLQRICLKALAADPEDRYATAAALGEDLRRHLRPPRRLLLLTGTLAGLLLAGGVTWLAISGFGHSPPLSLVPGRPNELDRSALTPVARPPLSGELAVRLWTPEGRDKRGIRVDEPGALPARNGEWVRLEAELNQPAYVYLLWLDGQGVVTPLYPWNDVKIVNSLNTPPPQRPPQERVHSPPIGSNKGWPLDEHSGLETVLLLARRTALPAEVKLAQVIGKVAPARLRHPAEVAIRGFDLGQPVDSINEGANRGIQRESQEIDDPLLQLMGRLQQHFEMIRAVRFGHQGT
jgi:serine/threonine protein kinase